MQSKLEELFTSIENSDAYKKYKTMEDILDKDMEIKSLITEIKELEKEATYLENNNDPGYKKIDKIIKEKAKILENNPVYQEYLNKMDEFNDEIAESSKMINDYVEDVNK